MNPSRLSSEFTANHKDLLIQIFQEEGLDMVLYTVGIREFMRWSYHRLISEGFSKFEHTECALESAELMEHSLQDFWGLPTVEEFVEGYFLHFLRERNPPAWAVGNLLGMLPRDRPEPVQRYLDGGHFRRSARMAMDQWPQEFSFIDQPAYIGAGRPDPPRFRLMTPLADGIHLPPYVHYVRRV
jgi:hypothetical protein